MSEKIGVKNAKSTQRTNTIAIINGPNINILGIREPDVYGNESWLSIEEQLVGLGEKLGINLIFYQSNHQGDIVDFIQSNLANMDGVVINPAAYTKTGYGILDALTSIDIPFVEVHLSNILSRGGWHAETIFAEKAIGHINGFKGDVYNLGVRAINNFVNIKLNKGEY
jgi:3-dehydroquinate dehydratase II